ncbi:bublin coiled-coil protein-like [Homalodisca vitripennis]|uniref:bublin coiled-coil protein-like n=1 Tax=Homalodisca vitripennis TaxID=197043 RepID=UPI001EECB5B6|nr:bublin coiled-coil protein-like [Homalodisca vitripennis]XP_046688279.1 bublin coiled-coil protein-like [Homalodisca vitripennis]
MKSNTTKPTENSAEDNNEEMEMEEETEEQEQEYETLNSKIDQLNLVLDVLERKNDDIQAQLVALLKSSREEREKQQPSGEKPTS